MRSIPSIGRLLAFGTTLLLAPLVSAVPAAAQSFDNGCEINELARYVDDTGKYDPTAVRIFAISDNVPVHDSPDGAATADTLQFGRELWIIDPGTTGDRMQVSVAYEPDNIIGWIDRSHALCRSEPLLDPNTGIWRRVYIQTATRVADTLDAELGYEPKKIYRSPTDPCDNTCEEVSRFEWFFVYADIGDRLLIADGVSISDYGSLGPKGWLLREDGIDWNTASALRPIETLDERDPPYMCAYPTLEDLRNNTECREFPGGYRWFEIDLRLPVIDETEDAWHVIFKGGGSNQDRDDLIRSTLNEGNLQGEREALKNLDVLFLIDGTESIEPAINAIKGANGKPGLIEQLKERIAGKLAQGGTFRAGYRVFRDSAAGQGDGVSDSEALSLATLDCKVDNADFASSFAQVQAKDVYANDNDFEENLMGGMAQALRDLASCPSHPKAVIVIGDHGYSAAAQTARGYQPVTVDKIVRAMENTSDFKVPPWVFFIQMPKTDAAQIKNDAAYEAAYANFGFIAQAMIDAQARIWAKEGEDPAQFARTLRGDLFFQLAPGEIEAQVIQQIADKVGELLLPREASDVAVGGQSILRSMEILQKRSGGVPILWARMAERRFCESAPEQCETNILEKVDDLYIRKSDAESLVPEVIMTLAQLDDWIKLLESFQDLSGTSEQREQLLDVLSASIEGSLGVLIGDDPHPLTGERMDLGMLLQMRTGLPTGFGSKLLSYRVQDFLPDGIPHCEVGHISDVATRHIDVLNALKQGTTLPQYEKAAPDVQRCIAMSETGKSLETINGNTLTFEALNPVGAEVTRDFTFQQDQKLFYWIPQEYLP